MKTAILCGGRGMRLNDETEFKPKPLVEIGGMPILSHIMKHYLHFGHRDFILPLGYKGDMIKDYYSRLFERENDFSLDLKTGEREYFSDHSLDAKLYFCDTGLDSMTGSRLFQVRDLFSSSEDFFLTYGDGVSSIDIEELYGAHRHNHSHNGALVTVSQVIPSSQFGVIRSSSGMVTSFQEKPAASEANINGGYMVCNRGVFDYLSSDPSCVLEDSLASVARDGKLGSYIHNGFWHCMDNPRDVQKLNNLWSKEAPWKLW